MKTHALSSIDLDVPSDRAFAVIADPAQLPRWTHAFAEADGFRARMRTPRGEVEVGLAVRAAPRRGTVDWEMTFPDGTVETAYSRVVPLGPERSVFSFLLLRPRAALEDLEGDLDAQSATLARELADLKRLLENGSSDGAAG